MEINYDKVIFNGKTVKDFIVSIEQSVQDVMDDLTCFDPPKNRIELCRLIRDLQPIYKGIIPEVNEYFVEKYGF